MSETATAPVINVENLCLALNTGEPVVQDVSYTVGAYREMRRAGR